MPLSSQRLEEDEKVTKCIVEVLSDTLSRPNSIPVTAECIRILKEDERVLAMLRHQNLLRELEELASKDKSRHKFNHEEGQGRWEEGEDSHSDNDDDDDDDEDKMEKRGKKAASAEQRDASKKADVDFNKRDEKKNNEEKKDQEEIVESEKLEEMEEEEREKIGKDDTKVILHKAKEIVDDEKEDDDDDDDKRSMQKKHFGEDERREHGKEHEAFKLKEMMEEAKEKHTKEMGLEKRHGEEEDEDEEEDDSEEEEEEEEHRHHEGHHGEHNEWEEEEDKKSGAQQLNARKRVDENASDEETAQFEAEEKGVKISNSHTHSHGGHGEKHLKPKMWEDKRHLHSGELDSEGEDDFKKRHHDGNPYLHKKHNHEEEEEEEEEEVEVESRKKNEKAELENLEEIELDLKRVAEKLRELRRG
nr:PREDICTED: coiled-coil domain-containing glutamate-rich protein 2 [Latimeria chalumnae]|eukprot:XP_005987976.1 PREDICTED: coiled-coil domain-containing glutamate-rich protein 2 [Latimeria chalumnae]